MPDPWKSPYENIEKADRFTLSVDVSKHDHFLIKSVTVSHGAVSKFIQTLIHDIAEYARANHLSYVDSDAFLNYLRQRADSQFARRASERDGRSEPAAVCRDPAPVADQSPSVPETAQDRLGNRKAQTGKGVKRGR